MERRYSEVRRSISLNVVDLDDEQLDKVFFALADRTRRRILAQLALCDASVSELAEPHTMSLPAIMKHLQILSNAGLVSLEKTGRVRRCHFEPEALRTTKEWVDYYREFWRQNLQGLEAYLTEQASSRTRKGD